MATHNHHPSPPPPPPPQPPSLNHLAQTISSLLHRVDALESSLNLHTHQPLRHAAARVIQTRFRSLLVRRSRTLSHLKHLTPSSSSDPHFDFSAPSLKLGLNPPGGDSDAPFNLNADPYTCETGISIPSNCSEQLAIVNPCSTSLTEWKKDEIKIGLSPPGVDSDAPLNSNTDPATTCGTGITIPSSNGSEQLAIANTTTQPHGNGECKKDEIEIVQSAYNCEVCKIDCRTKQNLDQHKLGKKHKKNLEKLTQDHPSGSSNPAIELEKLTQVHPSGSSSPAIGPQQEQNDEGKSIGGHKKKRKNETPEDLERKKKKLIECGTVADAVRTCDICNVVCNNESVYKYHLAGKKHVAMVKKASDLGQGNGS